MPLLYMVREANVHGRPVYRVETPLRFISSPPPHLMLQDFLLESDGNSVNPHNFPKKSCKMTKGLIFTGAFQLLHRLHV